jgi:hypothetical protein
MFYVKKMKHLLVLLLGQLVSSDQTSICTHSRHRMCRLRGNNRFMFSKAIVNLMNFSASNYKRIA